MKALKKVVYYNHVHGKNEHDPELRAIPDEAFAAKMEKVALAYANWDKEQDKVLTAIEKDGWNAVYNRGGFEKADKAMDKLAWRYNLAHGTNVKGEDFGASKHIDRAYFTAINHGAIQ